MGRRRDNEVKYIDHNGQTGETDKAKFFDIGEEDDLCVPKSVIIDDGDDGSSTIGVEGWWYNRKEEEGLL